MYPKHSVYGHLGVWVDLPGPLGNSKVGELGFRASCVGSQLPPTLHVLQERVI